MTKKKIGKILTTFALSLSIMALMPVTSQAKTVYFTGESGFRYSFNSDSKSNWVGWNYTTSGQLVKIAQSAVTKAGYSAKGIDGKFGDNTYNAIYKYQNSKASLTADGCCGTNTWNALEKSCTGKKLSDI